MPESPTLPAPVAAADHLYFSHAPGSVPLARRWARGQVADAWGVPGMVADDVALVVGELAGNVVKHVPRVVRGCVREFHVFLELLTPDAVRVEVHDAADADRLQVTSAGPDDEGCRGLMLIQSLAAEWGVCPRAPFGKIVWARLEATA
jgi:hypothetical protein